MGTSLQKFLEVCYDGASDLKTWSTDLMPAITGAMGWKGGAAMSFASVDATGAFQCRTNLWDRAERLEAYAEACVSVPAVQQGWEHQRTHPFRVISLSQMVGVPAMSFMQELQAPADLMEQVGVAIDCGTLVMSLPLWSDQPDPPPRRILLRMQRHLATAATQRLRDAGTDRALAVFDARGRTLESSPLDAGLLARAESLARAIAEDIDGRETDAAEQIWEALWDGGYAIARITDTDGKRIFVLRRARPEDSRQGLTRAERRVVELAMRGTSLKVVASELGTSASTVSTHLGNALRKLGLEDRTQLAGMFGGVGTRPARAATGAR